VSNVDLSGYNDVASRMREFFDRYPDGRLRPASPWRVETIGEKAFVVFEAAAFRTADDPNPGVGTAWEPFPGRTPYTRDSELMNAETSAWGRAILAVGAADTRKGVASAEEVRNRQADRDEEWNAAKPASEAQVAVYDALAKRIAEAPALADIPPIGRDAATAKAQGHIAPAQYNALDAAAGRRIAELKSAAEGTEDKP
jgi:hypothetical protein